MNNTNCGIFARAFLALALAAVPSIAQSISRVVAWGDNSFGQTNVPPNLTNVVAIASGYQRFALKADGTVVAWGSPPGGLDVRDVPAYLSNLVAIAATGSSLLALREDGTVIAWGDPTVDLEAILPAGLSNVML